MSQSQAIPLHMELKLTYLRPLVPSCPAAKFILRRLLTKLWRCPRKENVQKNN